MCLRLTPEVLQLANTVLLKKKNRKWRMCKACPKDGMPLPSINILINSAADANYFLS
jgi:hypothetical protein